MINLDPSHSPRSVDVSLDKGIIYLTHYINGVADEPIKLTAAQTDNLITALIEARKKLK